MQIYTNRNSNYNWVKCYRIEYFKNNKLFKIKDFPIEENLLSIVIKKTIDFNNEDCLNSTNIVSLDILYQLED